LSQSGRAPHKVGDKMPVAQTVRQWQTPRHKTR